MRVSFKECVEHALVLIKEVNKNEELIGADEAHDILEEIEAAYADGFIQTLNDISINHEYTYENGITTGRII